MWKHYVRVHVGKKKNGICGNIIPLDSFMYKILYQFPIHSQLLRVGKIEGDQDLGFRRNGTTKQL
jgi:hypothetical protein